MINLLIRWCNYLHVTDLISNLVGLDIWPEEVGEIRGKMIASWFLWDCFFVIDPRFEEWWSLNFAGDIEGNSPFYYWDIKVMNDKNKQEVMSMKSSDSDLKT